MSQSFPALSVVVLNFRTPEQTVRALNSVKIAADHIETEEIVVDNASRDDSPEIIRSARPGARVIELHENTGFAFGMNAGAREAKGEYILLLNSDIEAAAGSVSALVNYMRANPDVGLVAPVLLNEKGGVSRTLLVQPTLWRMLVPAIGKMRYKQWQRRIGVEPLDVEATEGAAFVVSRKAVDRAGLLDEDFFFYHEIVEWCMRIRDNGLRIVVLPDAKMMHLCGGSTGKVRVAARIELKRSEYQLLRKRLGACAGAIAVLRDLACEGLRVLSYTLLVLLSLGMWSRMRIKLVSHFAVFRWIASGMPARNTMGYKKAFGGWD